MTTHWFMAFRRAVRNRERIAACSLLTGCLIAVGAVGLMDAGAAWAAPPCEPEHCYALAEWNVPSGLVGGTNTDIYTADAQAPGIPNRVQNETWNIFSYGGWVEAGDTEGWIGYNNPHWTSTPVYFTASDYLNSGFYESDSSTGPAPSETFDVDQHYVPSITSWYVRINGTLIGSWGSQPSSATRLDTGLEETSPATASWGQSYNLDWWSAQNGVLYSGWVWDSTHANIRDIPAPPNNVTCTDFYKQNFELWFQSGAGPC